MELSLEKNCAPHILFAATLSRRFHRPIEITALGNLKEIQKIGRANIEAATKAADTLTKATQTFAAEIADGSMRSFESSTEAQITKASQSK